MNHETKKDILKSHFPPHRCTCSPLSENSWNSFPYIDLLQIIALISKLISVLRNGEIIVSASSSFHRVFLDSRKKLIREPFASRVAVDVINFAFYLLSKLSRDFREKRVGFIDVFLVQHVI